MEDPRANLKGLKIRLRVRFMVVNYVTNDMVDEVRPGCLHAARSTAGGACVPDLHAALLQLIFDNDHIVLASGLGVSFKGVWHRCAMSFIRAQSSLMRCRQPPGHHLLALPGAEALSLAPRRSTVSRCHHRSALSARRRAGAGAVSAP